MISWSLRAWSWRLLQAHETPQLQVQKSCKTTRLMEATSGPRSHRQRWRGSILNQGGRCRWFIAWVAHVVHNCWWQQKGVHYPHCYKNESHTAKRHEEKGVAVEALNQKSVRWWFLFWLVRKGCFKCSIHFQQKVKSTFKTPFKANSLQGGFVCFLTASIEMPL